MKLLKEIWQYRDLLKLLVSRDIKLKYRRSALGYIWSILNPLLIMIVMSVVFNTMFARRVEHFPVYLFCGQLLFNFMNNSTHQAIHSITANAPLLKKTYVPRYIFTVSKITSGMVDLVLSLGALLIVVLYEGVPITFYFCLFPMVIIQLYFFCVGLGLFLSQANVFFRDIQYIYNAVTTAWMYLTPIFYSIDILPTWLQKCIKYVNPMYHYATQLRDLILEARMPGWGIVTAGCLAAAVAMVIGVWSFARSKDKFILYI